MTGRDVKSRLGDQPSGLGGVERALSEHPLAQLLAAADDEKAVVSVIADRDVAGRWRLRHGTCLIVPRACADQSWAAWLGETGATSANLPLPSAFVVSDEDWLIARQPVTAQHAQQWVRALIDRLGVAETSGSVKSLTQELGTVPELVGDLQAPSAVLRAMPHVDSAASNFVMGAGRPASGCLLRAPSASDPVELPNLVQVGDAWSAFPSRDLAGIYLPSRDVEPALRAPDGLFVGRLERRAWIVEMRGTETADHVKVTLAWEPRLVDPTTLSLRLEEYTDDRELIVSEAVHLADLDLAAVKDKGTCVLGIPSAGAKLRHGVSLYGADGSLLDRCDPYPFVEVIGFNLSIAGPEEDLSSTREPDTAFEVGRALPSPTLDERVVQVRAVRSSLKEVRRRAAHNRVLHDRVSGRRKLRALLEGARDYLLVMDGYFGQDEDDWALVAGLHVPVRVLTSKVAEVPAPVPSGVDARIRPKATKSMHDRRYLWREGGLGLGGSPSTIGHAPVGIQRLTPDEAAFWEAMFDGLWNSGLFQTLERR